MAHLPPNTAIFSPSVARLAASTAKDWSYVETWLSTKFNGRTPPPFERNPDTLKALLTLASLNEAADEDRDLIARVESAALQDINLAEQAQARQQHEDSTNVITFKSHFLTALEDNLTREGQTAFHAMASSALSLGLAFPEPNQLGQEMLNLQTQVFTSSQTGSRLAILRRYIHSETSQIDSLLKNLQGPEYQPPSDLAKQNLELQRKIKTMSAKLPELRDKVSSLARSVGAPNPTIEQVKNEEHLYLNLVATRSDLDRQIKEFQGLAPDTDMARRELESLRAGLRSITQKRDAVFEGLVERETPRKAR